MFDACIEHNHEPKPNQVIIIHANEEATESLRNFCIQKVTEPDSTLAPPVGEAVSIFMCVCVCACAAHPNLEALNSKPAILLAV
jgi:hypothetical protein